MRRELTTRACLLQVSTLLAGGKGGGGGACLVINAFCGGPTGSEALEVGLVVVHVVEVLRDEGLAEQAVLHLLLRRPHQRPAALMAAGPHHHMHPIVHRNGHAAKVCWSSPRWTTFELRGRAGNITVPTA